ncbi:MAG TPA: anti-sigma B factor antagonist, partial [Luteimonas sp.]
GVAFLAELAARGDALAVEGTPEGLDTLRAAYRLSPALAFSH